MKITVTTAMATLFADADNSTLRFAERALALGLGDRTTARPYVVQWVSDVSGVKPVEGQRGLTFAQNSAELQRVTRILGALFPSADQPSEPARSNKQDPVASLFKRYEKLDAAQRRRFRAMLAK